jgi:hypothetical protein
MSSSSYAHVTSSDGGISSGGGLSSTSAWAAVAVAAQDQRRAMGTSALRPVRRLSVVQRLLRHTAAVLVVPRLLPALLSLRRVGVCQSRQRATEAHARAPSPPLSLLRCAPCSD